MLWVCAIAARIDAYVGVRMWAHAYARHVRPSTYRQAVRLLVDCRSDDDAIIDEMMMLSSIGYSLIRDSAYTYDRRKEEEDRQRL
jgi:hypothetical protein